jgi:ribosomal-protein-alanine N-acetyltransferase
MYDVRPMDRATAEDIATWRYDGPYSMYEVEADAIESFLNPAYQYFAVFDENNDVVGFCNFGEDARVPGFDYADDALDIGLGMRPDLTGLGKGLSFVRAVFDFARRTYTTTTYRVTIAAFNRRAQQLCLALGFREIGRFIRTNPEGNETEFVVLPGVKEE